jgi:hydroxymethylglutaryl-CoA lyase
VASEDVVYLMAGLGVETGVDLAKLVEAGEFICRFLGKKNGSKVSAAACGGATVSSK